jgi:hypothetical protein
VQDVTIAFTHSPEPAFPVLAASVLPDQDRASENASAVIEADPAFAQILDVLDPIPLELHFIMVRFKRTWGQIRSLPGAMCCGDGPRACPSQP